MDRHAVIRRESDRLAAVLGAADPAARCPTCPDWTVADLLWHFTETQWFWSAVLERDALTDADIEVIESAKPERPADLAELLVLRDRATGLLLDQLGRLDDAEPRWSWWTADQTVGFTRRMQTYEATMHRIDAELAAGESVGEIAADVAAGAVDHCVDVMWGWMPDWAAYEPLAVVEFVATDRPERWLVELGHWSGTGPESGKDFDEPRAVRAVGGGEPTATVTAAAHELARWAWSRGGIVEVAGEPPAVEALERLLANGIQ